MHIDKPSHSDKNLPAEHYRHPSSEVTDLPYGDTASSNLEGGSGGDVSRTGPQDTINTVLEGGAPSAHRWATTKSSDQQKVSEPVPDLLTPDTIDPAEGNASVLAKPYQKPDRRSRESKIRPNAGVSSCATDGEAESPHDISFPQQTEGPPVSPEPILPSPPDLAPITPPRQAEMPVPIASLKEGREQPYATDKPQQPDNTNIPDVQMLQPAAAEEQAEAPVPSPEGAGTQPPGDGSPPDQGTGFSPEWPKEPEDRWRSEPTREDHAKIAARNECLDEAQKIWKTIIQEVGRRVPPERVGNVLVNMAVAEVSSVSNTDKVGVLDAYTRRLLAMDGLPRPTLMKLLIAGLSLDSKLARTRVAAMLEREAILLHRTLLNDPQAFHVPVSQHHVLLDIMQESIQQGVPLPASLSNYTAKDELTIEYALLRSRAGDPHALDSVQHTIADMTDMNGSVSQSASWWLLNTSRLLEAAKDPDLRIRTIERFVQSGAGQLGQTIESTPDENETMPIIEPIVGPPLTKQNLHELIHLKELVMQDPELAERYGGELADFAHAAGMELEPQLAPTSSSDSMLLATTRGINALSYILHDNLSAEAIIEYAYRSRETIFKRSTNPLFLDLNAESADTEFNTILSTYARQFAILGRFEDAGSTLRHMISEEGLIDALGFCLKIILNKTEVPANVRQHWIDQLIPDPIVLQHGNKNIDDLLRTMGLLISSDTAAKESHMLTLIERLGREELPAEFKKDNHTLKDGLSRLEQISTLFAASPDISQAFERQLARLLLAAPRIYAFNERAIGIYKIMLENGGPQALAILRSAIDALPSDTIDARMTRLERFSELAAWLSGKT
jgi:hypothetical protein